MVMEKKSIWIHEAEYAQDSVRSKLERVRERMRVDGISTLDVMREDDIAWLCNLRGSGWEDPCTPKFQSAIRIEPDRVILYADEQYFAEGVKEHLAENGIEVRAYGLAPNCIAFTKCYKTASEIEHMRRCHVRDGVTVTKFIYRLKQMMAKGEYPDEIETARMLDDMRKADPKYVGLSFRTINGYGPHGAGIHYQATPETNIRLEPKGFIVVDSGGQYLDGTTDITRTIALGELTQVQRQYYTYVMQGMLRLLNAHITPDEVAQTQAALADGDIYGARAVGRRLDEIARKPLKDQGLDYAHGTGHGVGYLGYVHELPRRIPEAIFAPGLIMSDEPGVYIDGEFGVRIENLMLCEAEDAASENAGGLHFTSLTWCPLERAAVVPEIMTADDIRMYNTYQRQVWETISPYLDGDEREWLRAETAEIG